MKNFFAFFSIICLPLMLSAQQKQNPQQQQDQLRREMQALQLEMQQKIQSLQDSLAKLQQELSQQQHGTHQFFEYKTPDKGDYYFSMPDSFNWDHSFNFDFNFPKDWNPVVPPVPEVPPVEPFEFHYNLPDIDLYKALPYEYQYHMEVPHAPEAPDLFYYHEKKHKHDDILRMLPFYDWFKS